MEFVRLALASYFTFELYSICIRFLRFILSSDEIHIKMMNFGLYAIIRFDRFCYNHKMYIDNSWNLGHLSSPLNRFASNHSFSANFPVYHWIYHWIHFRYTQNMFDKTLDMKKNNENSFLFGIDIFFFYCASKSSPNEGLHRIAQLLNQLKSNKSIYSINFQCSMKLNSVDCINIWTTPNSNGFFRMCSVWIWNIIWIRFSWKMQFTNFH